MGLQAVGGPGGGVSAIALEGGVAAGAEAAVPAAPIAGPSVVGVGAIVAVAAVIAHGIFGVVQGGKARTKRGQRIL